MKHEARIDAILARSDVRPLVEEFRQYYVKSDGRTLGESGSAFVDAAQESADVVTRIVAIVEAELENTDAADADVYRYLAMLAWEELVGPMSEADRSALSEPDH